MSGVLWAYGGVVNSQPDNNQEKINPVSHLTTIFGADCNLLSTGFGIGIHPSLYPDTRCCKSGGSSGRILAAGEVLCPLSGRGLWEPARDRAAGDQTAPCEQSPPNPRSRCPSNPSLNPSAGTRKGGAARRELHPHRLRAVIYPLINFHLAFSQNRS